MKKHYVTWVAYGETEQELRVAAQLARNAAEQELRQKFGDGKYGHRSLPAPSNEARGIVQTWRLN